MHINNETLKAVALAGGYGIGIVFCSNFIASFVCRAMVTFQHASGSEAAIIAAFLVLRCVIYFSVLSKPWHTVLLIRRKQQRGPQFVLKSCVMGITLFVLWIVPEKEEAVMALYFLTAVLTYQYIAVTWKNR